MTEEIKEILKKTDIDAVSYGVIINYITNLQKEKEIIENDFKNVSEKYFFEKKRNERAIERLEKGIFIIPKDTDELLNILQGGDE